MASQNSPIFIRSSILWFSVSLFALCSSNIGGGCALIESKVQQNSNQHHHTFRVSSLLPNSVCSASTKGLRKGASLKVVNKHGACSHLTPADKSKTALPTVTEFLTQDQSRVSSIQSRVISYKNSGKNNSLSGKKLATSLPAKPGGSIGTGNYLVVIGLGTPKRDVSLIFDTGSDLTWTQCQPCVKSCYKQQDPTFDPSLSKSYKNISCTSAQCSQLTKATGNTPDCSGTTCVYGIQYGDQSFSVGFLAAETLTLTSKDVFPNFLFGCGQNNQGLFGGAAGLLGLGRDKLSIVSQTASKYGGKYFSYCLPTQSSTGYLTFGKGSGSNSNALKFTPLSIDSRGPSFYFIDVVAIKCGATVLSIPQSVFKTAGTIIDSGTVITRLPSTAYTALSTEFKKQMAKYPMAQALSILDTCYDLSNYTTVTVPKITFFFGGNTQVPLDLSGILYAGSTSQVCLAFAGNSGVGILGNVQQQTLNVVYDVAGGKLGFGLKGCS